MNQQAVVQATRRWVEDVVVDLNLCPFARRELINNRVRFAVTDVQTPDALLGDLQRELLKLVDDNSIETTLLIHPGVLQDFHDYNDFLAMADGLVEILELEGVIQIASFHPHYQFAGTAADAAENYTNRSPWPMLHLLREASLEKAIAAYPDTDAIPRRNIERVEALGANHMKALLQRSLTDPSNPVG
ncbi:DUF1415 domain-containing protein [Marinobacter zhanjiangensis]|uniref:DUF1415 domain-containing protein n=1 Tax=Marinobacter zhanjiangensis TaxID=578215 RepID=A0ABQ3APE9_9GAMM|nr:DUF1415 domain-containing protein [Marinobacter zhanjiangensis]GGY59714.1 hypothetical protein GCM10007071_02630 [Marinobacter zhanjiangensis]